MKCRDCQFYKETYPKQKSGLCEIRLPPWLDKIHDPKFKPNFVDAKDGCDMGQQRNEDDEL